MGGLTEELTDRVLSEVGEALHLRTGTGSSFDALRDGSFRSRQFVFNSACGSPSLTHCSTPVVRPTTSHSQGSSDGSTCRIAWLPPPAGRMR